VDNGINFLLIITSFLSALSVALLISFKHINFLSSLIFQIIILIFLLQRLFFGPIVHWFESKETLENLKSKNFDRNLFATLKTAEDETFNYQNKVGRIIENSIGFMVASIFLIILGLIEHFLNIKSNLFLDLILSLIMSIVTLLIYKKNTTFEPKNFKKRQKKYLKLYDKWISNP